MAWPFQFANVSTLATLALDANFNAVGALTPVPCLVAGTDSLTLTPLASTPTVASYSNYMQFTGIAVNTNTSSVSAIVGTAGLLPVYKDTSGSPALLTGGEIVATCAFGLLYDSALNSSNGGFHLMQITGAGGGGGSTSPGGSNTDVQFNDHNTFGGNAGFTYDITTALNVQLTQASSVANGGAISLSAGDGGATSGDGGAAALQAGNATTNGTGGALSLAGGDSAGSHNGGGISVSSGAANNIGNGGLVSINGGVGGATSGIGGSIHITSGITTTSGQGSDVIITSGNAATSGVGGEIHLTSGNAAGTGAAGNIRLIGGDAGNIGTGGTIVLTAGLSGVTSGSGGSVSLTAGDSVTSGRGGGINLSAGAGASNAGGDVTLAAGDAFTAGNGGDVLITSGIPHGGNANGGDIRFAPAGHGVGTGIQGHIKMSSVQDCADDAAASVAGVPIDGIYRTGSAIKIRVT